MRISAANVDMYTNRTYSAQSYEEETVQAVSNNIYIPMIKLEPKKSMQTKETNASVEETILEKTTVGGQKDGSTEENVEEMSADEAENTDNADNPENTGFFLRANRISTVEQKRDLRTIRQQCIQYILDMLFRNKERRLSGEKVQNLSYQEWLAEKQTKNSIDMGDFIGTPVGVRAGTKTTLQAEKTCYYSEKERTAYQTTGTVVTADGRNIEFNLHFAMSRSFEQYYNENYETSVVSFCDPLVINLDSTMPTVSDQKFLFDLDADGVMDTISMMSEKSGYLALDKNGDGQINDGSELFGTKSGDGFKDLAAYDEDGNGWIDEGDAIWEKLMIWCMDENGKTQLYHLSEKGIGAICLKNVSSDFSLNSLKTNQTNAAVRSTGIFLYENGNVGTVQHMDLAI